MERNLKISLDEAKKLYQQGNEAVNTLLLQTFTKEELEKKKLPESWEELKKVKGFYSEKYSRVESTGSMPANTENKNIFRTKEQAEAAIALAQLSQLMYVWNEGWDAKNIEINSPSNPLVWIDGYFNICSVGLFSRFLTFKNRRIAEQFIACPEIKKLIEQAKPLL